LVGTTAAAINFGVLYSLVEFVGIWYVYSNICGGVLSSIFNFFANKFWTFRNPELGKRAIGQGGKFIIVIVFGVVINTIFVYIFTDWGGVDYKISWIFATGIVLFWNFTINRLWTFKVHNPVESPIQS